MAVITISRQYSSGGNEIADQVCAMAGYRYFDKRLIAEVAADTRSPIGQLADFSEDQYRLPSFLDRLLNRMSQRTVATVGAGTNGPDGAKTNETQELNEEAAIALTRAAIQAAYDQGNVVIVGRGGQAVLRGKPGVLHVRVEEPLELRIQRMRKVEGFTYAGAEEAITKHDRAAADYIKRFYYVEWSDPTLYHLIINSGLWDATAAAHIILAAVECLPATK